MVDIQLNAFSILLVYFIYLWPREGIHFDGCEYKYMCRTCVPVIEYITTSCCAVIFDLWSPYICPKTDLLIASNEAQAVEKTLLSLLCPILYNCTVSLSHKYTATDPCFRFSPSHFYV